MLLSCYDFKDLAEDKPEHAQKVTDIQNDDYKLKELKKVLQPKHRFNLIMITYSILTDLWVFLQLLLEFCFHLYLHGLVDLLDVENLDNNDDTNCFDQVQVLVSKDKMQWQERKKVKEKTIFQIPHWNRMDRFNYLCLTLYLIAGDEFADH